MTDDELTETAAERLLTILAMVVIAGLIVLAMAVDAKVRSDTERKSEPKMGHAHRLDVPNAPADMAEALRGKVDG